MLLPFKSTVDWCEENYAVSEYIAEFWNTITFAPILLSAIYWRKSFPRLFIFDKSFHHIFWYLFLVSIGTALFHGTLLYKYQLLDELPMVLLSAKYVSLLMSLHKIVLFENLFYKNLISFFFRMRYPVVFIIIISYFYSDTLQIALFHGFLKFYEFFVFLLIYQIQRYIKSLNYYHHHINFNKFSRNIVYHSKMGLLSYSIAGLLWISDNLFCEQLQHLQLHAFWHITSSIGIYHLNCIVSYCYLTNNLLYYSD